MEQILISFLVVAAAEIGDKTQLLALCLASRFRRPAPILLGILLATIASNLAASLLGNWGASLLSPTILGWLLAFSFFGAAIWAFIPDKLDEEACQTSDYKSVFFTTLVTFFIAEMGDKTQLATVALAARFHSVMAVTAGTTLGMMAANLPPVLLSHFVMKKIPLRFIRTVSGILFALLGLHELFPLLR